MKLSQRSTNGNWEIAQRHLSRSGPEMARVIARVGPCTLAPGRDYFSVLCKAIFSQQISTKVAAVLYSRFRDQFPGRRATARGVAERIGDEALMRACGLSRQKRSYIEDLARKFSEGEIPTRRLARMGDKEVIEALTQVKGIGRWTAEMFLIFTLNRPDVLPVDDFGLRKGVQKIYGLRAEPSVARVSKIGEAWRPWRTVGTWYMWRGLVKVDE